MDVAYVSFGSVLSCTVLVCVHDEVHFTRMLMIVALLKLMSEDEERVYGGAPPPPQSHAFHHGATNDLLSELK